MSRNSTARRIVGPFIWRHLRLMSLRTGVMYQERWAVEYDSRFDPDPNAGNDHDTPGAVYIHRFTGPDPGLDMHDHPWPMVSIVVKGGYVEKLADVRTPGDVRRVVRHRWSVHRMGLDRCHQIVAVYGPTWTICLRGPKTRPWGFYTPAGWVEKHEYEATVRRERRDLEVVR